MARIVTSDGIQVNLFLDLDSHGPIMLDFHKQI